MASERAKAVNNESSAHSRFLTREALHTIANVQRDPQINLLPF
jgi:hypothetical protein